MITVPVLPALAGYVEAEIDGVRVYKNAVTGEIRGQEKQASDTEVLNALIGGVADGN